MAYAVGKYAKAICDRCGFEYPYLELQEEWNGQKTCPECYEPKHPQLTPSPPPADAEALYQPRVFRKIESVSISFPTSKSYFCSADADSWDGHGRREHGCRREC